MRGIDGHVVGEPARASPSRAPEDTLRHRALASLVVEPTLEDDFAGLEIRHRGRLESPQPLGFRRVLGFLRLPLARREQVPIRRIGAAVQPVERHELYVARLTGGVGLPAYAVALEPPRHCSDRLDPLGDGPVGGDEHGHLGRRLDGFAFRPLSRLFRPQVTSQHQGAPHDGRTVRIVGHRLEAEGLG